MSAAVAPESPAIPMATGPDPAVMEAIERGNSVVFLDVALGDNAGAPLLGRIKLELFVQDVSDLSGKRKQVILHVVYILTECFS